VKAHWEKSKSIAFKKAIFSKHWFDDSLWIKDSKLIRNIHSNQEWKKSCCIRPSRIHFGDITINNTNYVFHTSRRLQSDGNLI